MTDNQLYTIQCLQEPDENDVTIREEFADGSIEVEFAVAYGPFRDLTRRYLILPGASFERLPKDRALCSMRAPR